MVPNINQLFEEASNTALLMSTLLNQLRANPGSRILPLSEIETTFQRVVQDCRQLLVYLNNALRLWERQQGITIVHGDEGPVASRTRGALRRASGTAPGAADRKSRVKKALRRRR